MVNRIESIHSRRTESLKSIGDVLSMVDKRRKAAEGCNDLLSIARETGYSVGEGAGLPGIVGCR